MCDLCGLVLVHRCVRELLDMATGYLPPDPLHPLVVDHPARRAAQESCHLPVSQPPVFPYQSHKVVRQLLLVFPAPRDLALCRPVLAERRTGPARGD